MIKKARRDSTERKNKHTKIPNLNIIQYESFDEVVRFDAERDVGARPPVDQAGGPLEGGSGGEGVAAGYTTERNSNSTQSFPI